MRGRGDHGASLIEYALLLAFVILCTLAVIALLGGNIELTGPASAVLSEGTRSSLSP